MEDKPQNNDFNFVTYFPEGWIDEFQQHGAKFSDEEIALDKKLRQHEQKLKDDYEQKNAIYQKIKSPQVALKIFDHLQKYVKADELVTRNKNGTKSLTIKYIQLLPRLASAMFHENFSEPVDFENCCENFDRCIVSKVGLSEQEYENQEKFVRMFARIFSMKNSNAKYYLKMIGEKKIFLNDKIEEEDRMQDNLDNIRTYTRSYSSINQAQNRLSACTVEAERAEQNLERAKLSVSELSSFVKPTVVGE